MKNAVGVLVRFLRSLWARFKDMCRRSLLDYMWSILSFYSEDKDDGVEYAIE